MNIGLAANIVGISGTILIVLAYFLVQFDKLDINCATYNWLNFFGSVLLPFSLSVHFNLASFVIELFWIAASLIGLYKVWRRKNLES